MSRAALLVAVGLLVVGVGSCTARGPDASVGPGTTIEHRFGSTVVRGTPHRIVSLDLQWTDALIAMDVDPVGYGVDPLMPEGGMAPWWDGEVLTGEPLALSDGLPMEKIAALDPDLILGTFTIADRKAYERLSGVAPTVAGFRPNYVEHWPELVTAVGTITDQPNKARRVIESVNDQVTKLAAEYPDLEGKTFAFAQYIVGDARLGVVANKKDGANAFFRQLGMTLPPTISREHEKTGNARVFVSTERIDLLRSDLLAIWVNGGTRSDLHEIPGFDRLPASRSDTVLVVDYAEAVALNTPTPLSWPYVLDTVREQLAVGLSS